MNPAASRRLLVAGLATALSDGFFACVLALTVLHSTPARLFQGIAATVLGRGAFDGGARTALLGVAMHFSVAFWWCGVFLLLHERSRSIRSALGSRLGVLKVASVYGPLIWMVMSCAVIPLLVHRAPTIGFRWWIQLIGHVPFVGLPIVASIGGVRRAAGSGVSRDRIALAADRFRGTEQR